MLNGAPPHMTTPGTDDTFAEIQTRRLDSAERQQRRRLPGHRHQRSRDGGFFGHSRVSHRYERTRLDWPPTNLKRSIDQRKRGIKRLDKVLRRNIL